VELTIISIFVLGYALIALEHPLKINKAASALLTGVLCWTVYVLFSPNKDIVSEELTYHLGNLSGILFFLMGAMTIVELIDAHDGFEVITSRITTASKRKLLWIISFLAFFLSAVLDNLTTAIVMASVTRKLLAEKKERMFFVGMVVIAANAGGAWSPIGDVTTTMLWIGGQITSGNIIIRLIGPSLICMLAPLIALSFITRGKVKKPADETSSLGTGRSTAFERNLVFFGGVSLLVLVPVFKTLTHLPPYMGILLALGILWVLTELIHHKKDEGEKNYLSVAQALRKIDVSSILFFLGILIAVSALESTHLLVRLAQIVDEKIGNQSLIAICIGLLSAIVDNVPIVAATMGMYDLKTFPQDSYLWEFIAYCAGTGGSILIIGSAAGVAVMGIEKIDFFWYLKKLGWLAALGYFAGAAAFVLQEYLLHL
jgi:Na+/H+ antiporter NhaD/arsenite permease-like protein